MTPPVLVNCKTEQLVDAYLGELKALLMLSFKEQPLKKADPYAIIGRAHVKLSEINTAAAARESSRLKRLFHEKAVLDVRANLELDSIETLDLL